ncbi:MAG: DEAD/DEAH box helicase [Fuscovulum sp.]|nr:MAG: DEAD/DEAH box helicase [Fuscovulum sp.]
MKLRDYQEEAVASIFKHFEDHTTNPLVVAPTGAGKSAIIADFVRQACTIYPATRILIVTHVKELIAQNHAQLLRFWPQAPAGIYSAGLGLKQGSRQIVVAGVQSIARKIREFKPFDLVIVDEAHLIPRSDNTLYGKLFAGLKASNPAIKIIGLTATPYRLDSGRLDRGEGAMFGRICYDIPVGMLVERGYLSPLVSKRPGMTFDLKGIRTKMGDWSEKDMAARFNTDEVTEAAVTEIVTLGADRASWLLFCISVEHAEAVRDSLRSKGISCETVTGATPAQERARALDAYKAGRVRALTSVGVLTTGFDAPRTDLLAFLRPTQSTGLYIQMAGRGMRTHPDKTDCLVLDFAGNVARHGPVDGITAPEEKRKGEGEAPTKFCPECAEILLIAARECPCCGFLFPEPEKKIERTATTEAIMNLTAEEVWHPVTDFDVARHKKDGSPDSLRLEYLINGQVIREWVCIEHTGFPRQKAVRWWEMNATGRAPDTVTEALDRRADIRRPAEAVLIREGKYHRIKRMRFGENNWERVAAE